MAKSEQRGRMIGPQHATPAQGFAGIDPGAAGGMALLGDDGTLIDATAIPILKAKTSKGRNRTEYDLHAICSTLREWSGEVAWLHFCVELLLPMPHGSKGGAFANYGRGMARGWEWLLAGQGRTFTVVLPQRWQADMLPRGRVAGGTKAAANAAVVGMLGEAADLLKRTTRCRTLDEGMVDAFLIAEWARRQHAAQNGRSS